MGERARATWLPEGLSAGDAARLARAVGGAVGRAPPRERDDCRQHVLMCLYADVRAGQRDVGRLCMRAWSAAKDYGRARDPLSRGQRRFVREAVGAERASERQAPALEPPAREADVAARLGLAVEVYRRRRADANVVIVPLTERERTPGGGGEAEAAVLRRELASAVDTLSGRLRTIIEHELAGGDQATLAAAMDVDPSRVCQLRRRAIAALRSELGVGARR